MSESETPRIDWDIRLEGRAWSGEEWRARRELRPDKIEMSQGKLFWSDEDRLNMLALLLENVGADRAVRLGNPQVWRDAIARWNGRDHT
jgi:hypothetical protein